MQKDVARVRLRTCISHSSRIPLDVSSFLFFFDDSLNGATRRSVMGNHELAPIYRTLHLYMAVWGSSPRIAPLAGFPSSCKKSDAVLRELRRKYLLRGSIVLTHCVLPPVHIGQDLARNGDSDPSLGWGIPTPAGCVTSTM